jgi:hypothetical protein
MPALALAPPDDDAATSLVEVVRRAVDPRGPVDEGRAAELGLFALAGELSLPGPELAFYASVLYGIARHHGGLAHLVSAHHESSPLKDLVDTVAIAAGRLAFAADLAGAFVEERILFRRRLSEVPAVREALARHRAVAARLRDAARAIALGNRGYSWAALVAGALAAAAGLAQLMGGTGLMEESRMPGVFRDVVALSCRRSGEDRLAEVLLDQTGAAGLTLDS